VHAPAEGAATGSAVAQKRYFVFVMAVWIFIPELRRIFDLKSGGFNTVSLFSFLPLLVIAPLALIAFRQRRNVGKPVRTAAVTWLLVFGYALIVGLASGSAMASVYSYVAFTLPLALGVWTSLWKCDPAEQLEFIADVLLAFVSISAIYAIYQYVSPPPWDAMWVYATKMWSVGVPKPFGLRPWGTLGAPGTFADVLVVTLIVNAMVKRPLPWLRALGIVICLTALLITLVRADWLALIVGLSVLLVIAPRRKAFFTTAALVIAIGAAVFGLSSAFVPEADTAIQRVTDRFSTFDDLGGDLSAQARQHEIDVGLQAAIENPFGAGLGQFGPAGWLNPKIGNGNVINMDCGYLMRFIEMGYLGVAGYVVTLIGTIVVVLRGWAQARNNRRTNAMAVAAVSLAVQTVFLFMDTATDTHASIDGLLFWTFVALGFRAVSPSLTEVAGRVAGMHVPTGFHPMRALARGPVHSG
jgi:O-antigen ligase